MVRGKGFEPSDSYETRHLPSRAPADIPAEVLNLAPLTKLSHPRTGVTSPVKDELVFGLFVWLGRLRVGMAMCGQPWERPRLDQRNDP